MFAVDQVGSTKSIGCMLRGVIDAFLARRVHVNSPLSFFDVVGWLQNEWRRLAT